MLTTPKPSDVTEQTANQDGKNERRQTLVSQIGTQGRSGASIRGDRGAAEPETIKEQKPLPKHPRLNWDSEYEDFQQQLFGETDPGTEVVATG